MLGQRVNNFEIVRLLGEGGMGAVYEAEHALIRKKVAVKVLRPELGKDGELLQRFFNEARATSAIRHPNIVEVIDLGFLPDGMPYLVMELLEGESLADRLGRVGKLELANALDFIGQTASALQAAHDNGIVHRDLKPDNLYLVRDQRFREREQVKVLDFGIAKLHGDPSASRVDTVAGTIWGTPPYMSPEQCRGLPSQIDHRTDIYALGVILYEALVGRPPFVGEGLGDTMMLHMGAEPPPLREHGIEVPSHVERAIMRTLEKRPEARFSSMAEFNAALHGGDASVVTLARAMPPAGPARANEERRSSDAAVVPLTRGSAPAGSFSARPVLAGRARADIALPAEEAGDHEVTRRQWKATPPEVLPLPESQPAPEAMPAKLAEDGHAKTRNAWWIAVVLAGAAVAAIAMTRGGPHSEPAPRASPSVLQQPLSEAPAPRAAAKPTPSEPAASAPVVAQGEAPASQAPVVASSSPHGSSAPSKSTKPHHGSAASSRIPAAPASESQPAAAPAASEPAPMPQAAATNAAPGYLSLDSEPWANVSLGGKQLGSTPLMRVPLPPGKHVLTLTNPELGASTSYTVEVKSGETVSRLVGWRKQ